MDTPKTKSMGTVDAVENGLTVDTLDMFKYDKVVTLVSSSWNGTAHIEISNDGTNWLQEGADVTGGVVRILTSRSRYVRFRASVRSAGSLIGSLYGVETVNN
jgi:hypothetical protein